MSARFRPRRGSWILLVLLLLSAAAGAQPWPEGLQLGYQGETRSVPMSALREQADTRFTFFDPYLGREVEIRGLVLGAWGRETFGEQARRLTLRAMDGFEVHFDSWPDDRWVLVTHHDGEPIGLREKGPLRLVEREYGDRDIDNLRHFNDWIWMIERIEAAP